MQAYVVFAHGSRDPQWQRPVQAVAERIRTRAPQALVVCAYLELSAPDLASAVRDLVAEGATQVRLLPMFLGVGKHLREDLPQLMTGLREAHPGLQLELLPAVGDDPRLLDLLAEIAIS